jgi:pimeloyl-ACP methyl ester carboxylesterase
VPILRVNDNANAYAERGAGAPVLLVHGSLTDQRHWVPQMDAFAEAGLHAVAVSLRHYWPERWDGSGGGFTIAQHMADLLGVVALLGGGGGPIDVVGHSRGAHVAFRLAEAHPAAVRRLVLAEPSGVLDATLLPPGTVPASYADFITGAVEHMRRGEVEEGLRSFADYTGGPGTWDRRPEERKQVGRDNAFTLLGQISEGRRPFSRASAEAIQTPTLLVGGALTQAPFVTVLDGLERAIRGARRVTIPGGTHVMNRDNPEAFNAAVLGFLAEGPARCQRQILPG